MRRIVGVFLLIGLVSQARGENLLDIYRLAQANDPTFAAARHAYEAAQEKTNQAQAGLLPALTLSGGNSQTKSTSEFTDTPLVKRDVYAWSWELQLTQPLIRMQNYYAYSESEWQAEQAQAQFALAGHKLILRVTQAYFEALIAQESIEVADAQVKAAEEQLALVQYGFEKGANAITDVHEAKSRAGLARAQHLAALNELDAKYAELEKLVGPVSGRLAGLHPDAVVPRPQPDDAKVWAEQARDNNPAVRALVAALRASETSVSRSRAEHLPTLDLVASYGKNYSSGNASTPSDFEARTKSRQVGLQLNMPLYAGGTTSSRVSEAQANRSRVASELEAARRQSAADAKRAYSAIANGQAQIAALVSAVESSHSAVTGNQIGYRLAYT